MSNTQTVISQILTSIRAQLIAEAAGDSATLSIIHSTQNLLMGQFLALCPHLNRNIMWGNFFAQYDEMIAEAAKTGVYPF